MTSKSKTAKNSNLFQGITVAALGFLLAVRAEKSVRRIILTGVIFVGAAILFKANHMEITFLAFVWMITMTFEIFNSALENAMDYACGKEYHPLIKKGKDFAGASVFVCSTFALGLSFSIMIRYLIKS